jgi:hypothetical protein
MVTEGKVAGEVVVWRPQCRAVTTGCSPTLGKDV